MQITILNEATDESETYEILHLGKEKEGLLIATPLVTIFIDPFESFAESVVELVGQPDLPEPRHPQRVHSIEELMAALAGSR